MKKLGQRRAAQTNHQRVVRLGMHEQKRHHAARVVERERMRIVDAHGALDRLATDVQGAHAAGIAHRDGRLRFAAQRRFFLALGLARTAAPTAATTSSSSSSSGCTRLVTPTSVLAGNWPGLRYPERVSRNVATLSA